MVPAAGVEALLVQFQPFEAEVRRFAQPVMPRLDAAWLPGTTPGLNIIPSPPRLIRRVRAWALQGCSSIG